MDLILGKQCQTKMGRGGVKPLEFKTFSKPMQEAIVAYCKQGGNIFVSGAFVGTDLWDNRLATADQGDYKTFVLGFPFESIRTDSEREALMNAVLTFFNDNK